jgi:hypothetical protein
VQERVGGDLARRGAERAALIVWNSIGRRRSASEAPASQRASRAFASRPASNSAAAGAAGIAS